MFRVQSSCIIDDYNVKLCTLVLYTIYCLELCTVALPGEPLTKILRLHADIVPVEEHYNIVDNQ